MRAFVTGGGGFLGRRLVELLSERGDEVTFIARSAYPDVAALPGVTGLQVDLRDGPAVAEAVAGHDVVMHVAALAAPWGRREDFWGINVDGTRNVIDGMKAHGVGKLVYCSTPSVIGYLEDVHLGRPEIPYATKFVSMYQESKAEAEQLALASNGGDLATVALRPHAIIGPRDRNVLPRLIQKSKAGKLASIGDGSVEVDLTVVDNAAWAHIDAAEALTGPDAECAGKPYFITNGEPTRIWDWLDNLLASLDLPGPSRNLSFGKAITAARIAESIWRLFRLKGEPPITQLQVVGLGRSHTFDIGFAEREIGYKVRVPLSEGTNQIIAWAQANMAELSGDA